MTEAKMPQFSPFPCQTENWEKLTPLEAKMKDIEQLSQSIADGFVYFMKQKTEMESTNGKQLIKIICVPALHRRQKSKFTHYWLMAIPVLRQTMFLP